MNSRLTTAAAANVDRAQGIPDLPLIREDLLLEMELRHRAGASRCELVELRRQYDELVAQR